MSEGYVDEDGMDRRTGGGDIAMSPSLFRAVAPLPKTYQTCLHPATCIQPLLSLQGSPDLPTVPLPPSSASPAPARVDRTDRLPASGTLPLHDPSLSPSTLEVPVRPCGDGSSSRECGCRCLPVAVSSPFATCLLSTLSPSCAPSPPLPVVGLTGPPRCPPRRARLRRLASG